MSARTAASESGTGMVRQNRIAMYAEEGLRDFALRLFLFGEVWATMAAVEASGPNVIEKPITMGLGSARRPNVIEKPITMGPESARKPNVIEKPITMGPESAREPNVIEKPITMGPESARKPNVIEKPITFGLCTSHRLYMYRRLCRMYSHKQVLVCTASCMHSSSSCSSCAMIRPIRLWSFARADGLLPVILIWSMN